MLLTCDTRCGRCLWWCCHLERIRGGCRGLLPLDPTISLLCPNAVSVVLAVKKLSTGKIVAFHASSYPSKILCAICWRSFGVRTMLKPFKIDNFLLPWCCTRDLSNENVVILGSGGTSPGKCDCGSVSGGCSELSIHWSGWDSRWTFSEFLTYYGNQC